MKKKIKTSDIVLSKKLQKQVRPLLAETKASNIRVKEIAGELHHPPKPVPHNWHPNDGVIFPKVEYTDDGICQIDPNLDSAPVPDLDLPDPNEKFEHPASELLGLRFSQFSEMSESEHPTADERHVAALKIQARRGELAAQRELTERFGPMRPDWREPIPTLERMTLWERILFVFRGYND